MKIKAVLFFIFFMVGISFSFTVDRVDVTGNKRIPVSRIIHYLPKPGDEFDVKKINKSIKDIHNLGYFMDITVDASLINNEFVLTYIVQEVPLIADISYLGYSSLSLETLKRSTANKKGESLSNTKLGYTLKSVKDAYEKEGYYDVDVSYRLEYVTQTSVNLIIEIKEGAKSKAYNIWFFGNEAFSDNELKDVLHTKEKDFWSIVNSSGIIQRDILELDRKLIIEHYYTNGYLNVTVGEPEILRQDKDGRLNYIVRINEGKQFTVSSVSIKDENNIFTSNELFDNLTLKEGEIFNTTNLNRDVQSLENKYRNAGYAMVIIDDQISLSEYNNTANVSYVITPGSLYNINRIIIKGNEVTKDNVIRRQFDVNEGDKYNGELVEEAQSNLSYTDYFEDIDIEEEDLGNGELNLIVDLKEKKRTGTFLVGVSYSTLDKLSGNIAVSRDNLLGTGYRIGVKASKSDVVRDMSFSFYNPWVFDKPYSLGFDIVDNRRKYDDYNKYIRSYSATFGYQPIKRRLYVDHTLMHKETDITDIQDSASKYTIPGLFISNKLITDISYSTLDNVRDPRNGYNLTTKIDFAGTILGGNTHFYRHEIGASYYKPLAWKWFGSLNIKGGKIWKLKGDDLSIEDRYELGGMYSIRGFKFGDISPKDSDGHSYGGDKFYQLNLEFWRVIADESIGVRGVLFLDIGQVFSEQQSFLSQSPRKAVGLGLRFFTPIGLLRLEYGFKLDKKKGESPGSLEFTIGNIF